jgi:hypothetical protein
MFPESAGDWVSAVQVPALKAPLAKYTGQPHVQATTGRATQVYIIENIIGNMIGEKIGNKGAYIESPIIGTPYMDARAVVDL